LYEGIDIGDEGTTGLITYMRTDSTNISSSAQQRAREVIEHRLGKEYVPEKPPVYTRKSKGAQEAHEAIRPTDPARTPEAMKPYLSQPQLRLYRLIWQRFIASQMRNAIFDSTSVDIHAGKPGSDKPYLFRATGSVIKFAGFIDIYREGRDDDAEDEMDRDALPLLTKDEMLALQQLLPEQHFTQPPPRFSEATLVKALEEQGIGRPSTYAPTIGTLRNRYYITEEERRLFPTELGEIVNKLLTKHFPNIVDYDFTSNMEEELDEIATGERQWVPVIREFYQDFHPYVEDAELNMAKVQIKDEPTDEICDKCGRQMVIKIGRFGKFIACPGFPECRNSKPLLVKTGVDCPECGEGDVVERRSKKGRPFYGCSRYPECEFISWNKPIGRRCPECNDILVEAGRRGGIKCRACNYKESAEPARAS
jgi:DNA topoisomerase I